MHSSAHLPFLVVHGDWFWIVLVGALAISIGTIVFVVRTAIAMLRAGSIVRVQQRRAVDRLEAGPIVLSGTCGDGAVKMGNEQVVLESAKVIVGRRSQKLKVGDRVLIAGDLVRATTDVEGKYRPNAAEWRMREPRVYAANMLIVRAPRWNWPLRIVFGGTTLVASYLALHFVGTHIVSSPDFTGLDSGRPLVVSNTSRLAIASALPNSRTAALAQLEYVIHGHRYHDDESVERHRELQRLMGQQCTDVGSLIPSGRIDEEIASARTCGRTHYVVELLTATGNYKAARSEWPRTLPWPTGEGVVAIATGNWREAAEISDRMATDFESKSKYGTTLELRESSSALMRRYRCFALYFRSLAGDANALPSLRNLGDLDDKSSWSCADILGAALPINERKEYLYTAFRGITVGHGTFRSSVEQLLWLEGKTVDENSGLNPDFDDVLRGIGNGLTSGTPGTAWLLALGVEPWRGDARNAVFALAGRVFIEVQRGDFAAARTAADDALRLATAADDSLAERDARDLLLALAVRDGGVLPPITDHANFESLRARRGELPEHIAVSPEECEGRISNGISNAQRGDGRPLASAMQSCELYWTSSPSVLGVLPLVKDGRRELSIALKWWHDDSWDQQDRVPFASTEYAATRRDLSRLIGDTETAARWGEIARRTVTTFDDRNRLIALVLWNL